MRRRATPVSWSNTISTLRGSSRPRIFTVSLQLRTTLTSAVSWDGFRDDSRLERGLAGSVLPISTPAVRHTDARKTAARVLRLDDQRTETSSP
jgi:hypothetical protein